MGKGYNQAPWIFKGQALYQLNLVRAEEARKHIPEGFRIVQAFGWTLGGVYLVRYSHSPVGAFDELVVLAGLVWNPPSSCAWAQRVYVGNKEARNHGISAVGLPSRLATFTQANSATYAPVSSSVKPQSWWNVGFAPHKGHSIEHPVIIHNRERKGRGMKAPVAQLLLPSQQKGWAPSIPLTLPNFSGGTVDHPGLLQYTCKLQARVRLMPGSKIQAVGEYDSSHAEDVSTVLKGRPVMCMEFGEMCMTVPKPQPLAMFSERLPDAAVI